jgi:hypothetical protein
MTHRFLKGAATTNVIFSFCNSISKPEHLADPTMSNETQIVCWVHGETFSFEVHIDPTKTITALQRAIAQTNPNTFGSLDARLVDLYVANIRDTEEERNRFAFPDVQQLNGANRITAHFPDGFKEETIHFVIKGPGGKQHSFILSTHIC